MGKGGGSWGSCPGPSHLQGKRKAGDLLHRRGLDIRTVFEALSLAHLQDDHNGLPHVVPITGEKQDELTHWGP